MLIENGKIHALWWVDVMAPAYAPGIANGGDATHLLDVEPIIIHYYFYTSENI